MLKSFLSTRYIAGPDFGEDAVGHMLVDVGGGVTEL